MILSIANLIADNDAIVVAQRTQDTVRYIQSEWNKSHAEPIDEGELRLFLCDERYGDLTEEQKSFIRLRRDEMRTTYGAAVFRLMLCEEMLRRHEAAFRTIPAAKSVHHGFLSGLLMHTLNMLRLADFLSAQYADTVNRSLLLTGTLLHDFAKEQEFTFSELGLVTDYSTKGQLLGHLVMGAQEVAAIAAELDLPEEKATLLEHLILSHHGQPEFGAAVLPQCAEAELLSLVDQIDSRMEIYREVLAPLKAGEFSQRIFALDNRRVYKHQ